jgi:hypothetical protein
MNNITPSQSWSNGMFVSGIAGLIVGIVAWIFVSYALDFWHIGKVLGSLSGFAACTIAAYALFVTRLREVPLNWVGVELNRGTPSGRIYDNGTHWIPPFLELMNVPAPSEKFILRMSGEKIDAQDSALIYFGISEDEGKKNRIQYSVVGPTLYIATDNPEDELKEAYLEQARLFYGQVTRAIGVMNEKTLFSDFIMLPPKNSAGARALHNAFRERLRKTTFTIMLKHGGGAPTKETPRLFENEAIETIMAKAGDFLDKAASWGIGRIIAFTPNVRENPQAEEAADLEAAMRNQMAGLDTKATKIRELAKQMILDGVNPDLAATLVAALGGQNVTVKNETFNISGLPEALREFAEVVIKRSQNHNKGGAS